MKMIFANNVVSNTLSSLAYSNLALNRPEFIGDKIA